MKANERSESRHARFQAELRIACQNVQPDGAPPNWRAIFLGEGAYARVFAAEEMVLGSPDQPPLKRHVVAKIFRDDPPDDFMEVFRHEVGLLASLGSHETIVALRGMETRRTPTFVCAQCGDVFHVAVCPECGDELQNQTEGSASPVLQCAGGRHLYHKRNQPDIDWLVRSRPCRHDGPCDIVNFLFRPCIFLDALDVHLGEFQELLSGRAPEIRGHSVYTIAAHEDTWRRETFLMRLDCMVRVAEALEFVHQKGRLHGDLAPENIMVSLVPRLQDDSETAQRQNTRLIDFGQARSLNAVRGTTQVQGRREFMAPEMFIVNSTVTFAVTLVPPPGGPKQGDGWQLIAPPGTDVDAFEEGDVVWDGGGGRYQVLGREPTRPAPANPPQRQRSQGTTPLVPRGQPASDHCRRE